MELTACCKINLGLRVLRRRPDGYHDIETVMVPVRGLYDTVSVTAFADSAIFPGRSGFIDPSYFLDSTPLPMPLATPRPALPKQSVLEISGPVEVDCPVEQNICMRALRLVQREFGTGEAAIRLHKTIPTGAGLGGGSADAAAVLRALSGEFALDIPEAELERLAAELGSDVPFFVRATFAARRMAGVSTEWRSGRLEAQLCTGRGEVMSPVELDLAGRWIAIAKPAVAVSTAGAYSGISLHDNTPSVAEITGRDISCWRKKLVNDFEESVFALHPEIGALRDAFYAAGALYAAMSGSGSAVFGIFDHRPARIGHGVFFHAEQFRIYK